jgi:hypothetical protein
LFQVFDYQLRHTKLLPIGWKGHKYPKPLFLPHISLFDLYILYLDLIMASLKEAARDAFSFIDRTIDLDSDGEKGPPQLFPKYGDLTSAKLAVPFVQLLEHLRAKYPGHVVTYADIFSLNLLAFATAGNATATLDIETDSIFRLRSWRQPVGRGKTGQLAEARVFAKYQYQWGNEYFILYCISIGISSGQLILKECGPGESALSHSVVTDTLLAQVGLWSHKERKAIYVYDMAWRLDEGLYEQMKKSAPSERLTLSE